MVGQPRNRVLFNIGTFRKKALGAYWLLLEPAPTCALLPGCSKMTRATSPKANPPSFSHLSVALSSSSPANPPFVYLNAGAFSGSKVARMFDISLDRNSLMVSPLVYLSRLLQFYETTLREGSVERNRKSTRRDRRDDACCP